MHKMYKKFASWSTPLLKFWKVKSPPPQISHTPPLGGFLAPSLNSSDNFFFKFKKGIYQVRFSIYFSRERIGIPKKR